MVEPTKFALKTETICTLSMRKHQTVLNKIKICELERTELNTMLCDNKIKITDQNGSVHVCCHG